MELGVTTVVGVLAAMVGLAFLLRQEKSEKRKQLEQEPPDQKDALVSLLFVAGPGYRLLETESRALTAGSVIEVEGQGYVVARLGPAPLPADRRRCAYVEPTSRHSPGRRAGSSGTPAGARLPRSPAGALGRHVGTSV